MYLDYYKSQLGNIPKFLEKYLKAPSLVRLKKIGYFCGMDYASKDIYDFREYISRYDHSLTVSLLTYKLTQNKSATIAALFHDVATPCFSHVIDYMNGDYEKQESTEEYTEEIIRKDDYLNKCLQEDKIDIESIIDFKQYTIVDNDRPKVCADRIYGVILTGIGWTKNLSFEEIKQIVEDLTIYENENLEQEISFNTKSIAQKIVDVSRSIDLFCHSKEDNYMMQLLAQITKKAIDNNYITYEDLFIITEEDIIAIFNQKDDLKALLTKFKTIKKSDIEAIDMPKVKIRNLNPLVKGIRILCS